MAKSETLPVQKDAEKLCKHTLIITNNLDNFPTKHAIHFSGSRA